MLEEQQRRLLEAFRDRLGPAIRDALENPGVIEVMVNGCGRVRLDTLHDGRIETDHHMPTEAAEAIIRLVAHHIGATANEDFPLVAGTLPISGERFQGILPPLTKAPAFTIRKRPQVVFHLDDYVADGAMTPNQAGILRRAVAERRNILVSGGTSSGKTTLLNALLAEPAIVDDRIILIEDTVELQCSPPPSQPATCDGPCWTLSGHPSAAAAQGLRACVCRSDQESGRLPEWVCAV